MPDKSISDNSSSFRFMRVIVWLLPAIVAPLRLLKEAEALHFASAAALNAPASGASSATSCHLTFEGSVQNLSHLAERHPGLAHAVRAPLNCWSFSSSMFRYLLVDHAVPAMWPSLAAARSSAD